MKRSLYPRLAWDGLRKNRRLSWPYLLTCVGMVAMEYILAYLASSGVLNALPRGSESIGTVLTLGGAVVLLFSLGFLYYSYSFLNRRRAREYGLYNVLGMGKGSLARIVLWESLMTAAAALAGGLALGAALSKLAELGVINLMGGEIDYRLRLDGGAALRTAACFIPVFALNALAAVIRTRRSSAVNLLKAESAGEKPPRENWALALAGAALLAAAYWMAVTIKNPLDALGMFFEAVVMVIAATYLLMIAGSVWLCRWLQRNKRYYYRADHFVSVSSMAFRMKRNGAGLASICVIATMVLVMLSTTTCLMAGTEAVIQARAPREINARGWLNDLSEMNDDNFDAIRDALTQGAEAAGATPRNVLDLRYISLVGTLRGDEIQCDYTTAEGKKSLGVLRELFIVSAEDYAAASGEEVSLNPGEAMLLLERCEYPSDTLTLAMGEARSALHIVSTHKGTLAGGDATAAPGITVIVPRVEAVIAPLPAVNDRGQATMNCNWRFGFDTGLDDDGNIALAGALTDRMEELSLSAAEGAHWRSAAVSSRARDAVDYMANFGGLFFIGVVLSVVFLLAAVLIIYYKQISEGYEDAKRFDIMRKLGMTRQGIRKSIAAQLRVVFMLPLTMAGVHLAFAFPMIRQMLMLLGMTNAGLFIRTTLISFAAFAAFYWGVYRWTSGAYYRIVSGAGE